MLLIPLRISSPISVPCAVSRIFFEDALDTGATGGEAVFLYVDGDFVQIYGDTVRLEYPPIRTVLLAVWLLGTCIAIVFAAISAYLLHWRFKDAVYRADLSGHVGEYAKVLSLGFSPKTRVYVSSRTLGPLTYGVFRPCIILPLSAVELDSEALRHILLHELQHIRGRHALINLLWVFSLCLHWFNPVAWLGWIYLRRDMETSCDANVIGYTGDHVAYAQTLLNIVPMQQPHMGQWVFPLAFGEASAPNRIMGILAYRPVSRFAAFPSFMVMICCIMMFAASPITVVARSQKAAVFISVAQHVTDANTTAAKLGNEDLYTSIYVFWNQFGAAAEARINTFVDTGEEIETIEAFDFVEAFDITDTFDFTDALDFIE